MEHNDFPPFHNVVRLRLMHACDSWTNQEDMMLMSLVQSHGQIWDRIVVYFPKRQPRDLCCRYQQICSMMVPNQNRQYANASQWTYDDDERLFDAVVKYGQQWPYIATMVPGKDEAAVRHRWNYSLVKRVYRDKQGVTRFRPEETQPAQRVYPIPYTVAPGQSCFYAEM